MQEVGIFLVRASCTPGKIRNAWYKYIMVCGNHTIEEKVEVKETTGNRLVMLCAVDALKRMRKTSVITIYTDCRYLINGHGYLQEWKDNGWKKRDGRKLKNVELWQQLYDLQKNHAVRYRFENMEKYR